MCAYNDRKTKNCTANPKHTFKEVKLCNAARTRGNIACAEDTWQNLEGVMKMTTSISCAICNGLIYTIAQPEQAAPADN